MQQDKTEAHEWKPSEFDQAEIAAMHQALEQGAGTCDFRAISPQSEAWWNRQCEAVTGNRSARLSAYKRLRAKERRQRRKQDAANSI